MTGGADQTNRFIDEGIWEHNFDDNSRVLAQVRSMQTGERIAIKAAYVKKNGLDFETGGNTVLVMAAAYACIGNALALSASGTSIPTSPRSGRSPPAIGKPMP